MRSRPTIQTLSLPKTTAVWLLVLLACLPAAGLAAAQDAPAPQTAVYETGEATWAEMLSGSPGEAYLVYHLPDRGPERPALVVRLSKAAQGSAAVAQLFDAPQGQAYAPFSLLLQGRPGIPEGSAPAITLTAPDGWWVRDGIANYNLDIQVDGRGIETMWGAGLTRWHLFIEPDAPNARIIVRDTNADGLPDWDWRTMLPEFETRGDLRTNYAERKCDSPAALVPGASPQWPYVALEGDFEQATGTFRPPIVVDWATSRITTLSEMVTVRRQNCAYALYSIDRVLPGPRNSPDFETPFAFYDLSGTGAGYPNLILRTGRAILAAGPDGAPTRQTQAIRYSWSNEERGDGTFDYKVEVLGLHPYESETPIAGGRVLIDAPPYEAFPQWVIGRSWPVVSFVDATAMPYLSSEGIYEWGPGELGSAYFAGSSVGLDMQAWADLPEGLRGEYRLESDHPAQLYLSPIDNRLHLKWAERGLWRLDDEQVIRVANLDGDETIDQWSREAMAIVVPDEDEDEAAAESPAEPTIYETLYALDGYLLHAGADSLTLIETDYQPVLFETLPPTDHDTWLAGREQLAPYQALRRDPADLHGWLDAFPGPRSVIEGATLDHVRITGDGFRFELALPAGHRVTGPDLLGLAGNAAGRYLIENQGGAFAVAPLGSPELSFDIEQAGSDTPARVTVRNSGPADVADLELVVQTTRPDGVVELLRDPVDLPAGAVVQKLVNIPSTLSGADIMARLSDQSGDLLLVSREFQTIPTLPASRDVVFTLFRQPGLLSLLGLFAAFVSAATIMAIIRRRRAVL